MPSIRTRPRLLLLLALALTAALPFGGARAQLAEQSQVVSSPAVNTQNTLTVPAVTGKFARVDAITIGICQDATASAVTNGNMTTTNLGGLTWQIGAPAVASTCIPPIALTFPQGGLKAAAIGTAVTVVSPAAALHAAFPMAVVYHYAAY